NPHKTNNYADYNANDFSEWKETEQLYKGSGNGYSRLHSLVGGLLLPKSIKSDVAFYGGNSSSRVGDNNWYNSGGGQIFPVGSSWVGGSDAGLGTIISSYAFSVCLRDVASGVGA
ncbi:MAG: hypothetical protein ACRC5T_10285, partial [Cetobacterium sp.]